MEEVTSSAQCTGGDRGIRGSIGGRSHGAPEGSVVIHERHHEGQIHVIKLNVPHKRNAVNRIVADLLAGAVREFEADSIAKVAVLASAVDGVFCAGADLKAVFEFDEHRMNRLSDRVESDDGPMGVTRMLLSKPVIAAIEGYAVAGGLELALWCDIRVVARGSVFGVFCRRFGVPLIDGGTIRLPRLVGLSRALDMILTGRAVDAEEAFHIGLANRLVDQGKAMQSAIQLARQLCEFPQECMKSDRLSAYRSSDSDHYAAMRREFHLGMQTMQRELFAKQQRNHTKSSENDDNELRLFFTKGEGKHGLYLKSKL